MSITQTFLQQEPGPAVRPEDQKKSDRLRRSLEALLRSHRRLRVLGSNPVVSDLITRCGVGDTGCCQFEIDLQGRRMCLLCVPQNHWTLPSSMERFNEVRIAAAALGHRVLLAPEALVRDANRAGAAKSISAQTAYQISGTDRSTVISFLLDHGSGTLAQLASMLRHPDPVGAVLHLAVTGAVDIDLDSVIAPATKVRFPFEVH